MTLDLQRLRTMMEAATPGPWFWNRVGDDLNAEAPFDDKHFGSVGILRDAENDCDCPRCLNTMNGPLIAAMFNSLPALLRAAERAERLESALRWCRGNLTEDEHEAREIIDEALKP